MRVADERGLTLIEVLVATAVFAIVSVVALDAIGHLNSDRQMSDVYEVANKQARHVLDDIRADLATTGYQIALPAGSTVSGQPIPPVVEVTLSRPGGPPSQVDLKCATRTAFLSQAALAGDRAFYFAGSAAQPNLAGGLILYTREGKAQMLRVTSVDAAVRTANDGAAAALPSGTSFAVVDRVTYVYDGATLTRTLNGAATDVFEGVTRFLIRFRLNDGSYCVTPTAAQARQIKYAEYDITVTHERPTPAGRQVQRANIAVSQRVSLLNVKTY